MPFAKTTDISLLQEIALGVRRDVVESLAAAGSGHLGGSLGLADVFTALYFSYLNHDPENPGWPERDRLVLSVGHLAPVLYATLATAGFFPRTELKTLRKIGTRLQGHPGRDHGLPGIELSAGSLGQGLSVAVGMALAARMDRQHHRIVCLTGDGELQEGSIWEAAMAASHHKLGNLIVIVDRNHLQIDGPTEKVMSLEPLEKKWEAFGWHVMVCNGNDMTEILQTLSQVESAGSRPTVIIANTIMGKGVASIEGDYRWHGKAPSPEQAVDFLQQLNKS